MCWRLQASQHSVPQPTAPTNCVTNSQYQLNDNNTQTHWPEKRHTNATATCELRVTRSKARII